MRRTQALGHAIAAGLVIFGCATAASAMAQVVLGKTKHELDGARAVICSSEAAFGNVIANAMKHDSGADVAIVNCAVIKGERKFAAGSGLSLDDARQVLPDGQLAVLELTGLDLLTVLEQAFSTMGQDDGRFPQVAGLRLLVDPQKPAGQRIVKATVNGEALDFARTYRLATTVELAAGGLGYSGLASAKVLVGADRAEALSDALANYLRHEGTLDVKTWGRIQTAE